ncbi:MAG: site-specific integrase [Putridiphycobacter sp.]
MKITIRQKSGMQYLYADISVSGIRTKCSLGISVKEGKFNTKSQAVQGESDYETNILINKFKSLIMEMIRNLQKNEKLNRLEIVEGVKQIKEKLTNPKYKETKSVFFLEYVEMHISRSSAIRKKSTIKQYNYCLRRLKEFESVNNIKLTFDKINHTFYNTLINYLQNDLKYSVNSIGKVIKNIKMWMNSAYEERLHDNLIYRSRSFKKPSEPADTIYLNTDEILKITEVELPPYLDRVRDLFLLACYTGVRSQDYNKLNRFHFINNGTMLRIRTEKTDEEVIIPLHPEVKRIINKYNGTPKMITNQKFNVFIKEVCRLAGINESTFTVRTVGGKKKRTNQPKYKLVSSHTARRSFATNAYKAGVPSLAIMAITGHKTEVVFLKYIRVTKEEHAKLVSCHGFFGNVAD